MNSYSCSQSHRYDHLLSCEIFNRVCIIFLTENNKILSSQSLLILSCADGKCIKALNPNPESLCAIKERET